MPAQKMEGSLCGVVLFVAVTLCIPVAGIAQQVASYKDNKVTYSKPKRDTMTVIDPVTREQVTKVRVTDPIPVSLNGKKIHIDEGVPPQHYIDNSSLEEYVLKNLAKELNALPNGEYGLVINDIIVDEKGKVAYYNFKGIEMQDFEHYGQMLSADLEKGIKERVEKLITDAPAMKPATIKGKIVVAELPPVFLKTIITVKDHRAAFYKN